MSVSTASPYEVEQYRLFSGTTVIPAHRLYQYIPSHFALTHRQSKHVVSRNPLHRVIQSESKSRHQKVRVMSPHDQSDRSAIPPAASDWKMVTLDLVNAKFDSRSVTDFIFDGLILPNEFQMGIIHRFIRSTNVVIDQVAEELSKVNNSNSINPNFDFKVSNHPSLWTFAKFYDDFTQLVRKKWLQSPTPATSQIASPPVHTTVPRNPQYSSPSTASTSFRESKAEPHPNRCK